ncbi:MAG: DEAD/DEAH box helicase family protein [Acidimicrobiaceae bacterium]|nr:DEAD/DEAH box helicase family protein [Acidimicrobiaceae bacterium]
MPEPSAEFDPAVDPIVCSPYEEPDRHWDLDRAGRAKAGAAPLPGRRRSALLRPVPDDDATATMSMDLGGTDTENERINDIRERVRAWRADGWPGVTSVTRKLLVHWADDTSHRQLRPFFAQREAIETLIWLREAARRDTPERRDLEAASRAANDGIVRYCAKMATGTGKTAVMGMLIAWQTLNAVRSHRQRNLQHSSRFLVLTPGLTVRDRLAVLAPSAPDNVYEELGLVPAELRDDLTAARVTVVNFQAFRQRDPSESSGAQKALLGESRIDQTESPQAMMRRVVGDLLARRGAHGDLVVINDEAHHCYLPPDATAGETAGAKQTAEERSENKVAAVWFNAVRTLRDMGALGERDRFGGQASPVYDFSATPMWIGRAARGEGSPMFEWVASDFGLMDAIESGLVKVPRVPVGDDTPGTRTAWRRLYEATPTKKLPKRSDDPAAVLPQPLEDALAASVGEWRRTFAAAQDRQQPTPPVMIVVANTIDNAVALYEHIAGCERPTTDAEGRDVSQVIAGRFEEFSNVVEHPTGGPAQWRSDPRTLLVHSRPDDDDAITARFAKLLREQAAHMGDDVPADAIREALNTVGKQGRLGAGVRCVISVSMLTEGWDARTVNQIVGFRAFSSQLLCEQVTGRALRRTSYESFRDEPGKAHLLMPEYAEVLGIPFEFMPLRGSRTGPPPPDRTEVHSVRGRSALRVVWPQVVEYRTVATQAGFRLRPEAVRPAKVSEDASAERVEMAGVAGKMIELSPDDLLRDKAARVRCAAEVANLLTLRGQGSLKPPQATNRQSADDEPQEDVGVAPHAHASSDGGTATDAGHDGDQSDEAGLGGAGRCSLFGAAYRALRDWLAHPDVDCASASVLLRHRNKRDFYAQLIAACDFGTPAAATPPAADRGARPAAARRHGRGPVRDHAAPHHGREAQRAVARGVPLAA